MLWLKSPADNIPGAQNSTLVTPWVGGIKWGWKMRSFETIGEVYLPLESQRRLMDVARRTLEHFVRGLKRRPARIYDSYLQARDYGAFVSLHKKEELRGCIGTCAPRAPLFETVVKMTEAAAAQDHRVQPIARNELGAISIEITVLSPLTAPSDPLALEVGKYGLHVARDGRRGVLLPQVATRYGWDIKTFLEQTCLKADLSKNAWQDADTEVLCFTALIIEEQG
jgi:AmmeMemoRadiSam system protein A